MAWRSTKSWRPYPYKRAYLPVNRLQQDGTLWNWGRLHPSRLGGLAAGVARPVHDRTRLRAGIWAWALCAHLAAVNEAALTAGAGEAWGICGVSLRQPDTRDALAPQDGLYTLALRDADEHGEPRQLAVIGCLLESLVAPEDPRIAHEDARIVSLTVTEKGYCHDPASGQLPGSSGYRPRPGPAAAAQRHRLSGGLAAASGGGARAAHSHVAG